MREIAKPTLLTRAVPTAIGRGHRAIRNRNSPPPDTDRHAAAPGFHHLRLNSVDPDAAIAFYTRQFPSADEGDLGRPAGAGNRPTT